MPLVLITVDHQTSTVAGYWILNLSPLTAVFNEEKTTVVFNCASQKAFGKL